MVEVVEVVQVVQVVQVVEVVQLVLVVQGVNVVQVVRVDWVVRVVLVIKFVNAYGLHGLNNTHAHAQARTHTHTRESRAVFFLSRIHNFNSGRRESTAGHEKHFLPAVLLFKKETSKSQRCSSGVKESLRR